MMTWQCGYTKTTPHWPAEMLNTCLEDGDVEELLIVLRHITKAFGDIPTVAKAGGLHEKKRSTKRLRSVHCYPWFRMLGEKSIFFVTRLKDNTTYKLIDRRPVNRNTGVTSDHIIDVSSRGKTVRRHIIGYRDEQTGKWHEFLTNHFRLSAKTIADIYKLKRHSPRRNA